MNVNAWPRNSSTNTNSNKQKQQQQKNPATEYSKCTKQFNLGFFSPSVLFLSIDFQFRLSLFYVVFWVPYSFSTTTTFATEIHMNSQQYQLNAQKLCRKPFDRVYCLLPFRLLAGALCAFAIFNYNILFIN